MTDDDGQYDIESNESPAKADSDDELLLGLARTRFQLAADSESENRDERLEDRKFLVGEQWPEDIKQARDQEKRPCLVVNRLPAILHQVTNDQRQNRPSIKVNPVDDIATIETADVFQGLIRHIEYASNSDYAYDKAYEGSAGEGLGYFRVITQYADAMSFDQEIRIKQIPNSFSVYFDPASQEPDGSDANWAFVFEDLSKDDYKSQFPNSKLSAMEDWVSIGDKVKGWCEKDSCRIAEYFYKTFKETTLIQLSNGEIITEDELPKAPGVLPEGVTVKQKRKTILPAIKWAKINGIEVLEKTDWLGQWIPIIPVYGDEINVEGKRVLSGLIRHAKDPQRMYNYWKTAQTEVIALAPKAPWIGAAGQFEGHEEKWATANTRSHAFLEYNPVSESGTPVPPPSRNTYEPPVQAINQAAAGSDQDLKNTTGIFDPTLGSDRRDESGVAIQRRNVQAQISNFHYSDNLSRSIRHLGRILVDLIPEIYDGPQVIRVLKEDGNSDMVAINQMFTQAGQEKIHNLGAGRYDVTVSSGPSFQTKRQESAASMLDLAKTAPVVMQAAPDLIVKEMDWPGAQAIADRLAKTIPPQLLDDKNGPPLPPQAKAMLGQQGQMIQRLTQEVQQLTQIVNTKKMDLESKERIEMAKLQTEAEIELAKLGSKSATTMLEHQVAQIQARMDLLGQNAPIDNGNDPAGANSAPANSNQPPTGGPSPGQLMGA